jgi:hypothetical protein
MDSRCSAKLNPIGQGVRNHVFWVLVDADVVQLAIYRNLARCSTAHHPLGLAPGYRGEQAIECLARGQSQARVVDFGCVRRCDGRELVRTSDVNADTPREPSALGGRRMVPTIRSGVT